MSTGLIIALVVIVAAVVVVAAVLGSRARGRQGGRNLRKRFGPEYERTVAHHDGDTKAAERELADRVERHGDLRERALEPGAREQFEARWTAVQERFVDAPREAVTEADRLVAELAEARGFPAGDRYEEQLSALSVHHAHHVHGYRRVHRAAHTPLDGGTQDQGGTEELRASLLEARELFEALLTSESADSGRHRAQDRTARPAQARNHAPWAAFHGRHVKES
ncbi:hypothetical protein ABZ858_00925 [Streptomyces sp. NPDC047017]|uniref:hypothetical protein n=1 Tax=Streptomyces sp. NPDC047017 TaxID=3155024 RepID=UPI0033F23A4A